MCSSYDPKTIFKNLLKTKNVSLANVIVYLIDNMDNEGFIEDCRLQTIARRSGISDKTIMFAFQMLEANNYGKRIRHGYNISFKFNQSFIKSLALVPTMLTAYFIMSDHIDEKKNKFTNKVRSRKIK